MVCAKRFFILLDLIMNPKRAGQPFANDISAQPKKKFKEMFSSYQAQGRIIKTGISNTRTSEILYTNFVNEFPVDTALVGDSILIMFVWTECQTFLAGVELLVTFIHLFQRWSPTQRFYLQLVEKTCHIMVSLASHRKMCWSS